MGTQLTKGTTFASGGAVTHTNLNNLVDDATIQSEGVVAASLSADATVGVIRGQGADATPAEDDLVLVHDVSLNALKKVEINDLGTVPQPWTATLSGANLVLASTASTADLNVNNALIVKDTTASSHTVLAVLDEGTASSDFALVQLKGPSCILQLYDSDEADTERNVFNIDLNNGFLSFGWAGSTSQVSQNFFFEGHMKLRPQTVVELNAIVDKSQGCIAFCSDEATDGPSLAFYDGSNWKRAASPGNNIA